MLQLHNLVSSGKKRKRIGRGGGRGGTSGRGHQGQGSRSGGNIGDLYEGGQMPLARRIPKRGFNNANFTVKYEIVNLDRLEQLFDAGAEITRESLIEKGAIKGARDHYLKILGEGTLTKRFVVLAHALSKNASDAITKLGGEVHIVKEK